MGYNTTFDGSFKLDRVMDEDTYDILNGLTTTRRVKRNVSPIYGVDGEFYFKDDDDGIVNYNTPPSTQPGLWCQWMPSEDRTGIEWDEGEKFYNYVEWIEYIIDKILIPRDYSISGEVYWYGEKTEDTGIISIRNNVITIKHGKLIYE